MEYRVLGKTELKVSRLGFGGIPIQRTSQSEANNMFALCREAGINFVDTACGYGDSEEKIGQAIKGNRSSFILASKSPKREATGFRTDLEICLKLMGTEYLDLYQLHMVNVPEVWAQITATGGALEALLLAQKQGLVRYIGVSSHNNEMLLEMLKTTIFDTVQFPFNVVEQQFLPALQLAGEGNVGTIGMKPLGGGAFERADLALKFALNSAITTIIPGMDDATQVTANAAVFPVSVLTNEEKVLLENEVLILGADFCRRCEYCLPCPQNIRIPVIFVLESYALRYGLVEWANERYFGLPTYVDACLNCGLCEKRCPYQLPIREKLAKAASTFARPK
ncbi:MAG: aldo/keto reductase [bacterium]|nr:aldo/keto reductase [bacterium]